MRFVRAAWSWRKASVHCLLGVATASLATLLGLRLGGRGDLTNTAIGYLFVIALVSMVFGYGSAVLAAITSALCFDYFFLPPYGSFNIDNGRDLVTEFSMFGVAILVSTLNERLRKQARAARLSERRTESLYALAKDLADAHTMTDLLVGGVRQIEAVAAVSARILLANGLKGSWDAFCSNGPAAATSEDLANAAWVADCLEPVGPGTPTHPAGEDCYLPLIAERGCLGVLAIRPHGNASTADIRPSSLLQAMARQMAMAIERLLLSGEKRAAEIEAEVERTRSAILSAVSHELRTPLTVITSASSMLAEHGSDRLQAKTRTEMSRFIHEEAKRLSELLNSLLDVTRLQAGRLSVSRDWESLEEVVAGVLRHVGEQTGQGKWRLRAHLPDDLPLVEIDAVLIERVLLNLVSNALNHAGTDLPIEINVSLHDENHVLVSVTDHGRGIRDHELGRIFEKFYRSSGDSGPGLGLGLTLARGIVDAHGGRIWATPTPGGGLTVQFTLPVTNGAPTLLEENMPGESARAWGR